MGHLFTYEVDASMLVEGMPARIVSEEDEILIGELAEDNGNEWWLCTDDVLTENVVEMSELYGIDNQGKSGIWYAVRVAGDQMVLTPGTQTLELLDVDTKIVSPDKIMSEHTQMLKILRDLVKKDDEMHMTYYPDFTAANDFLKKQEGAE